MVPDRRPPSAFRLWYEEHLEGLLVPVGALVLLGTLAALYLLGVMAENVAGLVLAIAFVLACCGYAAVILLETAGSRRVAALVVAVAAGAAGVALVPVVSTLVPGVPDARASMRNPGDALVLPAGARGSVRLRVHGALAGGGDSSIEVELAVGEARLGGRLSGARSGDRMVRTGRAAVLQEHTSEYLPVDVPDDIDRITLASVRGELAGPLEVSVYRDPIPYRVEVVLAGLLLVAAALLAARTRGSGAAVGALSCALVFGLAVYRVATPDRVIRPEIGALFIGVLGGGIGGTALAWLMKKLAGPRAAVAGPG